MADENLENLEQIDDGGHGNSDGIGIAGDGDGIDTGDGADNRPTGDGDGTLDRGSVGTVGTGGDGGDASGDSAGSGSDGLDRELRDALGNLGTFGEDRQPSGDGFEPVKRGRGRPRKRDGGSRVTGDRGTGTASRSQDPARPKLVDLGKEKEPKKVPDSIFEKDSELSKLTKNQAVEMIAGVLQGLFFVPAQALGHKHWVLTATEAVELAKAIYDCLGTLPAKQSKKVDKFLKEYAPLVKLAIVGGSITLSRISLSVQMRQQSKNERSATDTTGTIPNPGPTAGNGFPNGPTDDFVIG